MISNNYNCTKIFICYSHTDEKWLDRLMIHLRPLVREGEISAWNDKLITPGEWWKKAINESISSAKVAILLVSADFLASEFIATTELPNLLRAAKTDGLRIIPIIISPSQFQQHQILSEIQALNDPRRPLIGLRKAEQEN